MTLAATDDGGEQSTAVLAVAAMGKKSHRVALGAAEYVVDCVVSETRGQELRPHDLAKVDARTRSAIAQDDRACRRSIFELGGDVFAHLEAARLDVRTDRR